MIAFEVVVNGEKACVAGIDDLGVLTAILSWVHRVPRVDNGKQEPSRDLTLEISGLQSARSNLPDEHLSWLHRDLMVGDTVTLNIKDLHSVDEPESRVVNDSEKLVQREKRRYFEKLKREFGE